MPDKTWFVDWFNAPYYYLLYENRNDSEALQFINKILEVIQPAAGSKMLDVACGKGRHSRAMAEMGFDVTGIDISIEAIKEAQKGEDDHLRFFQHDMRLPFWINYFDYAFNLFTSFGYFRTQREHDNAIRTIAQSITKGGLFVMDYLNVHFEEDHLQKSFTKQVNGTRFHISKWHDEEHFFKQIQVEETGVVIKHLFTEKVAKFSLGDLTDMFAYQGMQIQDVFGDYHLGHYDVRKSPRMIVIARKIRN